MLEEIKTLKQPKSKRIFIFVSALILVFEIFILSFIVYKDLSSTYIFFEVVKEILLNLIAATFAAIILVLVITYLLPSEIKETDVYILEPERTKNESLITLSKSTFWRSNGHIGRWVRTTAMPQLSAKSIERNIPTEACLIILNPKNDKVCDAYLQYRRSISFRERDLDSLEDVQAELLATIVCGQIYNQDPSRLKVSIYLNNHLSVAREDINSCAAFLTNINPRANSIQYLNRNSAESASEFYNSVVTNFEFQTDFCEQINFIAKLDVNQKQELNLVKLKSFLQAQNLLIKDEKNFLENVLNRIKSNYHPYK